MPWADRPETALCVDFGSTFTKAVLVDLSAARIVGAVAHRTTIDTDVLDGFRAARDRLAELDARAATAEVLACSSAGGGLRIAVVGNEELVTAEAGRRVALSSGGKVVSVGAVAGGADWPDELEAARPDVVLLVGGTDGGNPVPLIEAARRLVDHGWRGPVVLAGCAEAQPDAAGHLENAGIPVVRADNVVPRIGVLAPGSARAAVREMFLAHVIGGKHLSASPDFAAMVRGATPDIVLDGVELLARGLDAERPGAGDVVVVDVGGATTDVHSVLDLDPDSVGREVVATTPVSRTVEGDLGMRWSAVSTVEEAYAAGLIADDEVAGLREAAAVRQADPSIVPRTEAEVAADEAIARAAVGLGLRRHAGRSRVVLGPDGRVVERDGKDLREVDLLVGSGGVFRHRAPGAVGRFLGGSTGEVGGGWQLPRAPRVVVDDDHLLAVAGLLAGTHRETAYALLRRFMKTTG